MIKNADKIQTPALLLDLDILEKNLDRFQKLADREGKELWPMIKTHKSTHIARMQIERGAKGFLCGTLDECETLADKIGGGISIMYAYPVASEPNIERAIKLAKRKDCNFFLRIDSHRQAKLLYEAMGGSDTQMNYIIIINSGLNRFGIEPHEAGDFIERLWWDKEMPDFAKSLVFKGISTHPGHIYSAGRNDTASDVSDLANKAADKMKEAAKALGKIKPDIISTGSTPTFAADAGHPAFNILHPGNYVFNDCIQMNLHCAKEEDCALTVYATVISASADGKQLIIDAGSKVFGDQGVHGGGSNGSGKYGRIKNYPNLDLHSLSEEVGRIRVNPCGNKSVPPKIGDKIEIIPNHSCSTAYMADSYICVRKDGDSKIIDDSYPIIPLDMKNRHYVK